MYPFTNYRDVEFKAKWDSVEYTFPPMKTTRMLGMIPNATPLEIQSIRKKFAREFAIELWYGTDKFKFMDAPERGARPAIYTESDLAPFIQRCLEPLPVGVPKIEHQPTAPKMEQGMSKDSKGRNVSRLLDKDESLLAQGSANIE